MISAVMFLLLSATGAGLTLAQSTPTDQQTASPDTVTMGSPFRSVFLIPDSRVSEPTMMLAGVACLVTLPPSLFRAIQDSLPGFTPLSPQRFCDDIQEYTRYRFSPSQAMSVVVSDFNNDGRRDLVVLGHNRTRAGHLAAVSRSNGYQFVRVGANHPYDGSECAEMFLEHLNPDEVRSACVTYGKPLPVVPTSGFCEHGEIARPYWIGYYFTGEEFVVIGYTD